MQRLTGHAVVISIEPVAVLFRATRYPRNFPELPPDAEVTAVTDQVVGIVLTRFPGTLGHCRED